MRPFARLIVRTATEAGTCLHTTTSAMFFFVGSEPADPLQMQIAEWSLSEYDVRTINKLIIKSFSLFYPRLSLLFHSQFVIRYYSASDFRFNGKQINRLWSAICSLMIISIIFVLFYGSVKFSFHKKEGLHDDIERCFDRVRQGMSAVFVNISSDRHAVLFGNCVEE